jgi:hypothetical protein
MVLKMVKDIMDSCFLHKYERANKKYQEVATIRLYFMVSKKQS